MSRWRRQGFTVIECCAAAAMLLATLTVVVSLLTTVARQRQIARCHAQALLEADNLLERLTAEPYAELTSERVEAMNLDSHIAERLPQGAVEVRVDEEAGPPERKRIAIEITWRHPRSDQQQRQRLATWVYSQESRP